MDTMRILLTLVCLNIYLFCEGKAISHSDYRKCKPDLENGNYKQQRNGEIVYACDRPYVSNIPGLQTMRFKCEFVSDLGCFELKAASSRFHNPWGPIYLRNITCQPKTECLNPPFPENMVRDRTVQYEKEVAIQGVVQSRKKFYSGDTFEYRCQDGYAVAEEPIFYDYYDYAPAKDSNQAKETISKTITCDDSGKWNGQEDYELNFETCAEILCDARRFSDIRNGNITDFKLSYKFGEEMRLVCNEGYKPKAGISVVKCTTNSSFDYFTLPSFGCEPITCLDPVNPKNGQMRSQGVYVGDKAIFECNSGYNLIGSAEWTCLSNGKWDATCARCESKDSRSHCPAPCIPLGADVISVEDTFSVGSVLEFVCKSGGKFFGGSKERTCMRNGKWSGTPIDCTGESLYDGNVGMTLLNALEEQIPDNNTDEEVDAVASKTINVGRNGGVDVYFLVDVSRSITNEKFSATKRFINAILPVLGINDGETGTRLAVYYFASKSKKMYKDHFHEEPYVSYIEAQELISATHIDEVRNQTGSGTAITSVLEDIKQDLLTKRVNINKGVYRQAQQVIILLSDGVFTTAGSPIKTAEDLKTSFEVEIYSIFVGDVIDDKVGFRTMEEIASKKENEEHFFAITNRDNFDDVLDKMIRGAVNLSCGITQEHLTQMKNNSYQDEHNASPHAWPWMAELRSDTEHVCGGSLIEDQWILTAAHCFESKPVTMVHLKKLRLDQQMAFLDTPVNQNDIHLHPKFNKTDKTNKPSHLYDIALIKLQKKFPFSPRLLPVCLWNDNINNETKKNYLDYFADTTFGVATGWGSTKHSGKPENHLKQMQMNVKSHKECIQNLDVNQTKEVDENLMFCAGGSEIVDGIKKNIDVCTGDSGGPFVVEHPTQENKYIQTGIISFGFGCKQDGIYGFYTKLTEELLEWIRNTTASF